MESQEKTALERVDSIFAEHVLWYLGDTNLGRKPAPRVSALIHTIRCCTADESPAGKDYLAALRREFPEYVRLVEVVVRNRVNVDPEPLRRFVKNRDASVLDVLQVAS
ncbi:hypothetical protein [Microbacterium resistens]|nr:hypothetical protein [Streptomyces sp. MS2A]